MSTSFNTLESTSSGSGGSDLTDAQLQERVDELFATEEPTTIGAGRPAADRPPSPLGGGPDETAETDDPADVETTDVPEDSPFADEAGDVPEGELPSSTDVGDVDDSSSSSDGGESLTDQLTPAAVVAAVVGIGLVFGGGS